MIKFIEDNPVVIIEVGLVILILGLLVVLTQRLHTLRREKDANQSKQKSGEVRLGMLAETLAPYVDCFPVDVAKAGTSTVFIGQPIDYIHFDPDTGVTFIEIKSGKAKLNPSQVAIRKRVQSRQVHWREMRINETLRRGNG